MGTNRNELVDAIRREERDCDGKTIITDANAALLRGIVVGQTIVGFERDPDSGVEWGDGENSVTITLEDGSELYFSGYGFDASGLHATFKPPPSSR